ncbi:hypothetical protein [Mycobacteroides chelonae]|uniref:hypothetical protein n=1 Tax=Mycobacteroides chelonae TaxID=1774 RepID=UPI000992B775|nr:hypothetical protein [Mycobacteroides chelonae]
MRTCTEHVDDLRREWIMHNQGPFLMQHRRAELLGRSLRRRRRDEFAPSPDQHEDEVTPSILQRQWHTPADYAEGALVLVLAIVAPAGWAGARVLSNYLVSLIPQRLYAYPLALLFGLAALTGIALPIFYDPPMSLLGVLIVPWMIWQVPAALLIAAGYGILEGWLAIPESQDWLPLKRPEAEIEAFEIMEARDHTPRI